MVSMIFSASRPRGSGALANALVVLACALSLAACDTSSNDGDTQDRLHGAAGASTGNDGGGAVAGAGGSAGTGGSDPGECPETPPQNGSACGAGQDCPYTFTLPTCDVLPKNTYPYDVTCQNHVWYVHGNETAQPCPCSPPALGQGCQGYPPQISPCYFPGDPCAVSVCNNYVWDYPTSCAQHVVCPEGAPDFGTACSGEGFCYYSYYDYTALPQKWQCAEGVWTRTDGCPGAMPLPGDVCGDLDSFLGPCAYTIDPAQCDLPGMQDTTVVLTCGKYHSWEDQRKSEGLVACPCQKPRLGSTCGKLATNETATCEYGPGDPCETYECSYFPYAGSGYGAWDISSACAGHVSCSGAVPADGSACTGRGGCWFGGSSFLPGTYWDCANSVWTNTAIQSQ